MLLAPDRLTPDHLLLDARRPEAYHAGHLPGALLADPDRHLSTALAPGHDPACGGRHPLPEARQFAAQAGAWGIQPDSEVVVYDDASGGNAAARLWWMLRSLGHERVRLLDGGLQGALAVGPRLDTTAASPHPAPPYPATAWRWPMVDAEAVERLRQDPACRLLDVRAAERWRGEVEPFDPIAGHIPGSVNLPWQESLRPDGRFKDPEVLRAQFRALLGSAPPERVAVHCGSGVTACHTLLALELAGFPGAALYVGSWSEWCRSGRPRA